MGKKSLTKVTRTVLLLLLAAVIACGSVAIPRADAAAAAAAAQQQEPAIKKLEGVEVDYTPYLNSNVFQPLPSSIRDDEEISVIITLPVMDLMDAYDASAKTMSMTEFALSREAAAVTAQIAARRDETLKKLDDMGVEYTVGEFYDTLLAGFEVCIKAGDFETVCMSLDGGEGTIVSEVYNVAESQLVENTVNVYETGIFKSGDSGYDGSGMVVAVLDTGLDSNHTAFSVNNFTSQKLGMTYEDVAAVINRTKAYEFSGGNLTVDDVYVNEKVPFGYDYADNDPDVYSTHNNHGTHVSGVIVGKDDTITGVAPNAQLVSMKTFSDIMDTARATWILSALEDCVILDVDVVNMSLGTACGFAREVDEEVISGVYDRIRASGISVVVAASNSYSSAYGSEANGNLPLTSNPDVGTVGSPGTYDGVLSVASINGVETPYLKYGETIIYFDESTNKSSKENEFVKTLLGGEGTKSFTYVTVPGVGRSADYTGLDVKGKIALVRRGDNTFEEKAMIAQSQGAAAIIIYNNVSGEIKMNVGDATLAVCSISQDDGEMLAAAGSGTLAVSSAQTSGPFISDFSSWGPTPSLNIKPEITAHGGNILSSITGGGYDRLSGTSMACPNLAGVVILLRQYVVENFPEIADDSVAVNAMVNRLMMSTADIAINVNGQPYSVRKQGAGLANLMDSIKTKAIVITYDEDGKEMDKTKLELGNDPQKTGVYEMNFAVKNFGSSTMTYTVGAHVFTEGVSDTKTNAGKTTVTEQAHPLSGASITVEGSTVSGKTVTVGAGQTANVKVTVKLSDADKKYLNDSFENGMYVEGYITLKAASGVDLNVPYLAFYGDWTVAPLFDLTYFDTHADELDTAIDEEDKTKADAYATRAIGGVEDDFVSYLGTYYFVQDPEDIVIAANEDYVCLSNQVGSIHSLRFVWAGLLRNAQRIEIVITNDATGEVVFETVDEDVRKSYGDGGSIYPANIEIEFDTQDYNLPNNAKLTVTLTGYLDYGTDGGIDTNKKNVFSFPMYIDFEAPTVTDVNYYYEYDQNLEKNRLYAEVSIYDNHYAMCSQLGYVVQSTDADGNPVMEMLSFEQFMTPVYSKRNDTTVVTFELTDYLYKIKNALQERPNTFVVTAYDYALNYATYEIELPDNFQDFYFEGLEEGLTMSPNEIFTLAPIVYPEDQWGELLVASSNTAVVRCVNDKLVAVAPGKTAVRIRDAQTNKSVSFNVTVVDENDENFMYYDKPVADVFRIDGYTTTKAYYVIETDDKDIGETGDKRFFEGKYSLSMYPSESVVLSYTLDPYFPKDTTVEFESSNESVVKVDNYGTVTGVAEGFASVTVKVMQDGEPTFDAQTISVEIKDPYIQTGAQLTHYYGLGGLVSVPKDLGLTEIGNFAFSNFEYIMKTPEELAFDDAETSKAWYIGDNTITKVVLPEGIEKINAYAFANLTALEEIVLPSTLESIEYGAFLGCSSLEKITFSGEDNLKIISQNAFEGCALKGSLDFKSICVISNYAFAGCDQLESITMADTLLSIGEYAFAGCKKLATVNIASQKVKYGPYAFNDCEALKEFTVHAAVLPEGMFYQCENLTRVIIGKDVNMIGEFAFRETKVESFVVEEGNALYKVQSANHVLSADGKTLYAVSPKLDGEVTAATLGGIAPTTVGRGAFSHNNRITAVVLPTVTAVEGYGFASTEDEGVLGTVTLGTLTTIGEYAFFETGITELPYFTKDTVIDRYAFAFTDITTVAIPDGMTVGEAVFHNCDKLETVTIGNDVTIGTNAFSMNKDKSFEVQKYTDENDTYFYYDFFSALTSVTIGDNADIGDNAFSGHAELTAVTLGSNAKIGYMAFYNCDSLKDINLNKAVSIGDYAFSGDVYYECVDENMSVAAVEVVDGEAKYKYTYFGPDILSADLSNVTELGSYAFSYCQQMTDVILPEHITVLPEYVFAGCNSLERINLGHVTEVGDYAFIENHSLKSVDLSSCETVGQYAFVYCYGLEEITFKPVEATEEVTEETTTEETITEETTTEETVTEETVTEETTTEEIITEEVTEEVTEEAEPISGTAFIGEGAFSYCKNLKTLKNLGGVEEVGPYAFAYTAVTDMDLRGAHTVGDLAFVKEELTEATVTLGDKLVVLGDNPFAMCKLQPFSTEQNHTFNGVDYPETLYTYDISDTVKVIDGSLYCYVDTGMELITWAGTDNRDGKIAVGTVRVTAMALAGSELKLVTLPYTVRSVGHKAFYECAELEQVVFTSYEAPILEEEFDQAYYEELKAVPGTGSYGEYEDYDGTQVEIIGNGFVPYYMWNATGGMYSNAFYGANFVDYVGFVEQKLTMVRPINGQHYETFVLAQYFDLIIDGGNAADDVTLAAVAAIDAIPERVTWEQRALVEAARKAYDQVATTEQQALVTNYAKLISAEQRVAATAPEQQETAPQQQAQPEKLKINPFVWVIVVLVAIIAGCVIAGRYVFKNKSHLKGVLPMVGAALAGLWLWFTGLFKKKDKQEKPRKEKKMKKAAKVETKETAEEPTEEAPEAVTEEDAEELAPVVMEEETAEETEEEAEELVFPAAKHELVNGKERLIPGWKQLKEQNNK